MSECFCNIPDNILKEFGGESDSSVMQNPFSTEPDGLCRWAARQLMKDVGSRKEWAEELAKGKMMGVLIVKKTIGNHTSTGFLKAYSGQVCGRSDWRGFVPAVFDYLQPDGYFKQHESEIDSINRKIESLERSEQFCKLKESLQTLEASAAKEIEETRKRMAEAKQRRDKLRRENPEDAELQQRLISESQFQKAEAKRLKQRLQEEADGYRKEIEKWLTDISGLKQMRRTLSDKLQRWLFSNFIMLNDKGEKRNLLEIFSDYNCQLPPAGTGECCAPKLLQYAFANSMQPLALAEFWYGESPRGELRRHGSFYEPCRSKCYPLLSWMLSLDNRQEQVKEENNHTAARIIYDDDALIVVDKPSGMLSVDGLTNDLSVERWLHNKYPEAEELMMVHRLDMDTSGLIVVAKSKESHKILQQQFANHTIYKRYTAVVCGVIENEKGVIDLPLRPDYYDRPRQMVDKEGGRKAKSRYEVAGREGGLTRLHLFPETGRTHQLRVHCAHPEGLNAPIRGDRLYGNKADRLYLHADTLKFSHPATGRLMIFESEPPF